VPTLIFLFIIGITLLYFSADILIKSAVRLAELLKVRPFIIGITVVSFVSSVPELFISLVSLSHHHPDVMVGNIIGSNIANVGLILPIAVLIRPAYLRKKVLSRDVVVMFMVTILFCLLLIGGKLHRWESMLLFSAIILYNISLIHSSKLRKSKSISHYKTAKLFLKGSYANWQCLTLLIVGLIGMLYSANIIVKSAVEMAEKLHISKMVISISIVAIATALPELGMAVVGAVRQQSDILLGNIIGSNIYNMLFVVGFSGMIFPVENLGQEILMKLLAMLAFSFFILPFAFQEKVPRKLAFIFLLAYVSYISILFLP